MYQPLLAQSIIDSLVAVQTGEHRAAKSLSVVLGDDELLKELNHEYRGYDEPTDVLAFDLSDDPAGEVEGDIYISMERAAFQATQCGDKPIKETVRLAVHGYLHLCGWDHDDDDSLRNMVECGEKYIVVIEGDD